MISYIEDALASVKKLKGIQFVKGDGFYNESFDTAYEILDNFYKGYNHVILDALPQQGKTSVMEMIFRIINFKKMYELMNIDRCIYVTADDGAGDTSLVNQTKDDFEEHGKLYKPTLPIVFLKRSDAKKYKDSLKKAILMIDESHYGTRDINSVVQKFLNCKGASFRAEKCLKENNVYVVSVSATTQNERFGDNELKLKKIVHLKPGKGYVGVKEFNSWNCIKGLTETQYVEDYDSLNNFLKMERKRLLEVYEKTGVAKCIIMRVYDKPKKGWASDSIEFKNITKKNGFKYKIFSADKTKIDYDAIEDFIGINCKEFDENGKKFPLVIIKGAYSFGIRISTKRKKYIGTCYDVRKDGCSTEATEQGLLGRCCGYGCTKKDFEGIVFYISLSHFNGIIANRVEGNNEFCSPLKYKEEVKVEECDYNQWKDRGDKDRIYVFYNGTYIFQENITDEFFKRHKEFNYDSLFNDVNNSSEPYLKDIIDKFCQEHSIQGFEMIYDRRRFTNNTKNIERHTTAAYSKVVVNNIRRSFARNKRLSKEDLAISRAVVLSTFVDIRNADKKTKKGIKIIIRRGHIGFGKVMKNGSLKIKPPKKYEGFDTNVK